MLALSKDALLFEKQLKAYESRIILNLGRNGEPAYLQGRDKEMGEEALKKVALNTVLSDRMPLNRTLKDPRHKKWVKIGDKKCKCSKAVAYFKFKF